MPQRSSWSCWRWLTLALPALLVAVVAVMALVAAPARAEAIHTGDVPTAGTYIYDTAKVLTPAELSALEDHARAVRRAGAAVVVYLQLRDASQNQTQQDAADLMERWDIETSANARDGVVIFLNLQPGNSRHGQIALYAGQRLYNGKLPQDELARIYSDVMLPALRDGQTAGGIADGLDAIAHDLIYGPPPPSAAQQVATAIGRVPFNLLALLALGGVILLALRAPRRLAVPKPTARQGTLQADPPAELAPALAGALVAGRIHDAHLEATVLDFAHRGLIAIEPVGADKVHVRLLGTRNGLERYEALVWSGLEGNADDDRIITADRLAMVHAQWGTARSALLSELLLRGWFDPHAGARRRSLYLAGWLSMVAVIVGIILAILAQDVWPLLGALGFLVAGMVAFVRGYRIPETSAAGEKAALPWRAYRWSLKAGLPLTATDAQLDVALPYAVAMGVAGAINSRHVSATGRGYSPSWFSANDDRSRSVAYSYPYWIAFHSCMYPRSSGGSGMGGGFGGGAAAGGGGAGGGF